MQAHKKKQHGKNERVVSNTTTTKMSLVFEDESPSVNDAFTDEITYETTAKPIPSVMEEHFKSHCMLCGAGYLSESELETHVEDHRAKNIFSCEICKKGFYLK